MALIVVPFTTTSQLYNSATLGATTIIFNTIELATELGQRQNNDIQLHASAGHGKVGSIRDYVASSSMPDLLLYWSGSAQGFGVYDPGSGSVLQAVGLGASVHYELRDPPAEDHDRSVTSDESANVLQGANTIEWDVFPSVEIPAAFPEKERDLTRYHKAYSFTRVQPVRIRLIRR